jgi:subtilisin-like proprotein convertase family protein
VPVGVNDAASTAYGTPVAISVLANDNDPDGDALFVVDLTQPANGTVSLNAAGAVVYVPNPGFRGMDLFTYRASDQTDASGVVEVRVQVLPPPRLAYTNTTALSIPDEGTARSTITVAEAVSIHDLNVKINLTHQRLSDVTARLIGPDGTVLTLFAADLGGSGLTNTVFDSQAVALINTGTGTYSGNFRPVTSLNAFNGKLAAGVWTLEVIDTKNARTGTLVNWTLDIQG